MSKTLNMITAKKGGGVTASIKVLGDTSSTDTCYATLGAKTKQGVWTTVPNPDYHNLPSGYTELEYIYSSGTQYIDTGHIVSTNESYSIKYEMLSKVQDAWVCGTYATDSDCIGISSINDQDTDSINYGSFRTYFDHFRKSNKDITVGYGYYIIDGQRTNFSVSGGPSNLSFYLFTLNLYGSPGTNTLSARIYYFTITDSNNNKVVDFVPCISPFGVVGMYDLVSETFFGNNGTGEFIAGAEVPQTISYWLIKNITDYGTWTVHWSDGARASTRDVLIDVITEYTVENIERLYLYNEGDEYEDVTGGWGITGYARSGFTIFANTKQSNYILIKSDNVGNTGLSGTLNSINLNSYNKLCFDVDNIYERFGEYMNVGVCPNKSAFGTDRIVSAATTLGGRHIFEYDISNATGSYYIFVTTVAGMESHLYRVWLE